MSEVEQTSSLDDIFGDTPAEETEVVEAVTEETTTEEVIEAEAGAEEAVTDETETEDTDTEVTGEKQTEASPAPENTVPITALHGERERRQEADRRAETAERELAALRNQQPGIPDPYDDPEGYQTHLGQVAEQERQLAANHQLDDRLFQTVSAMSVTNARRVHDDYNATEGVFTELAKANPALVQQMRQHPDPAEFAYQTAKQYQLIQEVGNDPTAYENKIREQERAKVLKEFQDTDAAKSEAEKAKEAAEKTVLDSLPLTLAGERSVGDRRGPEWSGPKSLEAVIGE